MDFLLKLAFPTYLSRFRIFPTLSFKDEVTTLVWERVIRIIHDHVKNLMLRGSRTGKINFGSQH